MSRGSGRRGCAAGRGRGPHQLFFDHGRPSHLVAWCQADLLDVNLDLPDFDSKAAMGKFVRRCAVHPRAPRRPAHESHGIRLAPCRACLCQGLQTAPDHQLDELGSDRRGTEEHAGDNAG